MTSLQVLFGLPLGLAPSTSKSMHFFTQSFSFFVNTCPDHLNLCLCITVIISSIPRLFLNSLLENLSVILAPRSHLLFSSQPTEVTTRSLSSLATFHCHVTYNYTHNFCIISVSQEVRHLLASRGTSCLIDLWSRYTQKT